MLPWWHTALVSTGHNTLKIIQGMFNKEIVDKIWMGLKGTRRGRATPRFEGMREGRGYLEGTWKEKVTWTGLS